MMARASATRCCCPPDSFAGFRSSRSIKADAAGRVAHPAIDREDADAAGAQWKRDVVEDGQMRIQRVVLEDHRDVAVGGLEPIHPAFADPDRARIERFEPREQPEQRRLAAAGRPERHQAFTGLDVEIDAVDGQLRAEAFRHALEPDTHREAQYTPPHDGF